MPEAATDVPSGLFDDVPSAQAEVPDGLFADAPDAKSDAPSGLFDDIPEATVGATGLTQKQLGQLLTQGPITSLEDLGGKSSIPKPKNQEEADARLLWLQGARQQIETTPMVPLRIQDPKGVPAGIYNALAAVPEFFTSPLGSRALIAGALGGPVVARTVAGGFAADIAGHIPQQVKEIRAAVKEGPPGRAAEAITGGVLTPIFLRGLYKGATRPLPRAEPDVLAPRTTEAVTEPLEAAKTPLGVSEPVPTPENAPAGARARATAVPVVEAGRPPSTESGIDTGALGEIGMGGAKPAEFVPAPLKTGIKNAEVDKAREARGQEPIMAPERLRNQVVWDRVMERIDREPEWQNRLIEDLKAKPRTPSVDEIVALDHRYADLQNEMAKARRDGARHFEDGYEIGVVEAAERTEYLEKQINELEQIARKVGTEWGRSGQMRQRLIREDFSLAAMEAKERAAKGFRPLTEQEHVEIRALHEKLTAQEKAATEAAAAAEQRISILEVQKSLAEAKALATAEPIYEPRVLQAAEKFAKFMDKKGAEALARIKARMGTTTAGVDPTILSDVGILGAAKLTRGIVNKAKWVNAMVRDLGEWFREHADEAWEAAQRAFGKDLEDFHKGVDRTTKEKVRRVTTDLPGRIEDTKSAIKERAASAAGSPLHSDVRKLVRLLVEADPKITRDALIDTVHEILKESLPDITRLEAMDAISGRGKFWTPPKDEVSKTVRDLNEQIRIVGHQIDVEAGKPLPRTGYQRDKMSDAARREQQKLEELKRKHGVVVTDPTAQLNSALQSRKTYYTNRISDLQAEIASRERIVREKTAPPTDPALEALKAEYEKVKAEHDEIFGRRELTDEQRLNAAIAAAERAEVAAEATLSRAERGDFGPKPPGKPITDSLKLDEIRARTAALREETKLLRSLDEGLREQRRIAQQQLELAGIDERIAEAERRINEGDIAARRTAEAKVMPELEAKRAELEELNKVIARLRAAERGKSPAEREAKQITDLQAKADKLAEQINAGEIAVAKRTPKAASPEKQALRDEIAELNKVRQQLRAAARPRLSPEVIALRNLMARLAREKADLTERLAKGDFSPRRKAPRDIPLDTPTAAAKAEVENLRNEFSERLQKHRYEMKTRLEKIGYWAKQAPDAGINLKSSYDISAPRQAVGAILGMIGRSPLHPIISARFIGRVFGRQFQALFSERRAEILEQKRKNRPNARNGADEISGVDYTDLNSNSYTRGEEAARSIIDEFAKQPYRTGNLAKTVATAAPRFLAKGVRASNRAFNAFLNETRAELLDALIQINFKDRAPTELELKVIGQLVNVATGRGKMNPKLANAARYVLWSPKLLASRAQALTGQPFWGSEMRAAVRAGEGGRVAKIVAKEYAAQITGFLMLYGVSRLFSTEDEAEKTSSDFTKVIRGDTRVDLWGGAQQLAVLFNRLLAGETTTTKGKTKSFGPDRKFGDSSGHDIITRFIRNKFRPDLATAYDIIVREDSMGNPIAVEDIPKRIGESLVPLNVSTIKEILEAHGFTEAAILSILSSGGAGVDVYEDRPKHRR